MSEPPLPSAGWQVEQNASEAYEQYLVPSIFASWADQLIESSDVHEGDRILDVACGTGIVARRAASRVGASGSVVGVDINEGMLTVAKEIAADIQPSIAWRQADATDLPFSGEQFDIVCCQQAVQFFDDPVTVVGEMRRVLTTGGRVALSVWRPLEYQPGYVVLADALARYIGDHAGEMMRSPFPEWDADTIQTFVREGGFEDVSITIEIGSVRYPSVEEFVRREAASSPLAEQIAAVSREVRDDLVREVETALHAYIDDEGVVSPLESYVVIAERKQ